MRHFLTRIITFMAHPELLGTPKTLLAGGTKVITLGEKERVFTVRRVFYDDSMAPMYSIPDINEPRCLSVKELKEKYPIHKPIWDSPILNNDYYLSAWND